MPPHTPVTYLGEVTGDNMQVTPEQLLAMVARDLAERPAKGLLIQVVRDPPPGGAPGGPLVEIDHYRARVPYFVEVTVHARQLARLVSDP